MELIRTIIMLCALDALVFALALAFEQRWKRDEEIERKRTLAWSVYRGLQEGRVIDAADRFSQKPPSLPPVA